MALDDGRYLNHGPDGPRVLVIETEGGLPPVRRKRRRPRRSEPDRQPVTVPVTVATVVLAAETFDSAGAEEWLASAAAEPRVGELIETALFTLERGLSAAAATTGRAIGEPPGPGQIIAARVGYGEGERVYEGRFRNALEVDPAGGGTGVRRERIERIVPLARIAAILAGRESPRSCEVLVPRVRADLDAGRLKPAALTVGEAVRATLSELEFTLEDGDHERDLDRLEELLPALLELPRRLLGEGSRAAGAGEEPEIEAEVEAALSVAERVIRRYRISTQ